MSDTRPILFASEFRDRSGKVVGKALIVPAGHPKLAKQVLKFQDELYTKGNRTMVNGDVVYFQGSTEAIPDSAVS